MSTKPNSSVIKAGERLIEFLRKRDYILERELGSGACGKTVLLRDNILEQHFVCKKYSPIVEQMREPLFAGFVNEIKLLHKLQHPNVVRVFNCYLYPESFTGYVLLEYVDGHHIDDYIREHPERVNETFTQAIDGFAFLEKNQILHRDIRPGNVMVDDRGGVKIIDLGFGKRVGQTLDFNKSISLNWWCDVPKEFANGKYDFSTEVYFVGKLFEALVLNNDLEQFKYKEVLGLMCQWDPSARVASFRELSQRLVSDPFLEIAFDPAEIRAYRDFAKAIAKQFSRIAQDAKYIDDLAQIRSSLEAAYQRIMLADEAPDAVVVTNCFVEGQYFYSKTGFPVKILRAFLQLIKSVSVEKRRIILSNLWAELDAIKRYQPGKEEFDDDIPF
jgi:eukaryotic-like serine/threonine-protein kinase